MQALPKYEHVKVQAWLQAFSMLTQVQACEQDAQVQYERAYAEERAWAKASLPGQLVPYAVVASNVAGDGQLHVGEQQV